MKFCICLTSQSHRSGQKILPLLFGGTRDALLLAAATEHALVALVVMAEVARGVIATAIATGIVATEIANANETAATARIATETEMIKVDVRAGALRDVGAVLQTEQAPLLLRKNRRRLTTEL